MPLTRRQIYRRRRIAVLGGGVLVLATAFYLPLTLLAPIPEALAQVQQWQAPATVEPALTFPTYGASAVGAVGYPGLLANHGPVTPLPIASITKVVTALVVLQAHPLTDADPGPDITFSASDVQFYNDQLAQDGVVVEVYPGLVVSERNALTIMLMASANNYADSIADWAFGSHAAYVDAARTWLAAHELASTTITDPTGIQPTNVSTVGDLVTLATLAVADPVVSAIVATVSTEVPNVGTITNRNELLGIDGVDGIKTGTLDEAGSCLLFSAKETVGSTPLTLVGVVLGGPDHPTVAADVRTLLAQATAGFHEVTVTEAGHEFARYDTPWGDSAAAVTAKAAVLLLWSATPVSAAIEAAPVGREPSGSQAGEVTFTAGSQSVTVPLVLSETIADPGAWWRLTNPTRLF